MQKEKIKVIWPGEKPGNDTTVKNIYLSSVLFQGLVYFVIAYIALGFILWRELPGIDFPKLAKDPISLTINSFVWALSWLSPIFEWDYAKSFHRWLSSTKENSERFGIIIRFIILWSGALFAAFWGGKQAWVASGGIKHVRGKFILRGKEAFKDLQKEFWFILKGDKSSGLVVATEKPFNPIEDVAANTLKPKYYIEKPNDVRTKHQVFIGGSGRGKTQLLYFLYVAQIYRAIRNKEQRKLMVLDSPKCDYTEFFHPKHRILIAPHLEGSAVWDMAKDINNSAAAKEFWKGVIPPSTNDPIWSNAAVAIGTGATTILQKICPGEWNLGMLVYLLGKSAERLKEPLSKYYPEANQIMASAEETLSSVMFNISSYTNEFTDLARIYDGFESKKIIYCSTIKSFYKKQYLEFVEKELTAKNKKDDKEDNDKNDGIVFLKTLKELMEKHPIIEDIVVSGDVDLTKLSNTFTWEVFKQHILTNFDAIHEELKELNDIISKSIFEHILTHAKEWDEIETRERVSVREWLVDPNPEKKVFILQPYETSKSLTDGLIKGIIYFANRVILGELKDSDDRRMHILIDEFQSYGDIYEFMNNAFALYRSRGIDLTIAFQDLAQMQKIYGEEVVNFMLGNVGNIVIVGSNAGNTNQKLSELLGSRTIKKLHKSVSKGKDGSTSSEDLQDHEEEVMSPSEFNQLGANRGTKTIQYLYICGGLNPVYVLDAPLKSYPKRNGASIVPYLTDAFKEMNYIDFANWKKYAIKK